MRVCVCVCVVVCIRVSVHVLCVRCVCTLCVCMRVFTDAAVVCVTRNRLKALLIYQHTLFTV